MTDDEIWGTACDEMFGPLSGTDCGHLDEEHFIRDTPAHTALFHRTFPTYTESMWINAFPSIRCIVVTHPAVDGLPGVVRTLSVAGRAMASAEAFRIRFEQVIDSYVGQGWVRKQIRIEA